MIHLEAYEITVQIPASLLEQAKHLAAREHTTMRALIEEGLRPILADREGARPFKLRKASFKGNGLQPGLASTSWQQIRHASYGGGA
ncbi:MAG TPA: DUF2191 domain-containing protein [Terriglobia bacterium]|nr:DUF2191 domain-containing protein [Terriglobia bacterium]